MFISLKFNVNNLQVFGSRGYVHILNKKQNKMETKSQPRVFLVFEESCKRYNILVNFNKKVMTSRDVKFD